MPITSALYEKERLRRIADACVGDTVLDLGYAQCPNPYLRGYYRVGVDLNRPSDDGETYDEQLVGDVLRLSDVIRGRKFDTIILGELIEHLREPYGFLESMKDYLNEGGRLILSTPNPLGFPVLFFELFWVKSRFYTKEHVYYFLPRWIERLIDFSGYRLLEVRPVGFWLPGGWLPVWPKILSYQLIYICEAKKTGTAQAC